MSPLILAKLGIGSGPLLMSKLGIGDLFGDGALSAVIPMLFGVSVFGLGGEEDSGIVIGDFISVGINIAVGDRTTIWPRITSRRTLQ